MDLTIGNKVYVNKPWKANRGKHDPVDPRIQQDIDSCFEKLALPFNFPPLTSALFSTIERVDIWKGHIGFITLRSTWARLGLINPQTVADPGFEGNLTIEVFNGSANWIIIRPGEAIFSLTVVPCGWVPEYRGRYQGQTGITLPKAIPLPSQTVEN